MNKLIIALLGLGLVVSSDLSAAAGPARIDFDAILAGNWRSVYQMTPENLAELRGRIIAARQQAGDFELYDALLELIDTQIEVRKKQLPLARPAVAHGAAAAGPAIVDFDAILAGNWRSVYQMTPENLAELRGRIIAARQQAGDFELYDELLELVDAQLEKRTKSVQPARSAAAHGATELGSRRDMLAALQKAHLNKPLNVGRYKDIRSMEDLALETEYTLHRNGFYEGFEEESEALGNEVIKRRIVRSYLLPSDNASYLGVAEILNGLGM